MSKSLKQMRRTFFNLPWYFALFSSSSFYFTSVFVALSLSMRPLTPIFKKKEAGTKKIPIAVFSVYLLVYYFLCKCLHVMLSCCRRCCRCILLLRRIKYVYILSIYAVCVYRDASFFHKYI